MKKLNKYFVPVKQTSALPTRQAKELGVKPYALNPPNAVESYKRLVKPHAEMPLTAPKPVKMNGGGEMRGTNDDNSSPKGSSHNQTMVGSPYNNSSARSNARPSPNPMVKMAQGGVAEAPYSDLTPEQYAQLSPEEQRVERKRPSPDQVSAGAARARADAANSTAITPKADPAKLAQLQQAITNSSIGRNNGAAAGIQQGAIESGIQYLKNQQAQQAAQQTQGYARGGQVQKYASGGNVQDDAIDSSGWRGVVGSHAAPALPGVGAYGQSTSSPSASQRSMNKLAALMKGGNSDSDPSQPPVSLQGPMPKLSNNFASENLPQLQQPSPYSQAQPPSLAPPGGLQFNQPNMTDSPLPSYAHGGKVDPSDALGSFLKNMPKDGSKTIVIKGGNMSPEEEHDTRQATMQALQHMLGALQEEDEDSDYSPPKSKK